MSLVTQGGEVYLKDQSSLLGVAGVTSIIPFLCNGQKPSLIQLTHSIHSLHVGELWPPLTGLLAIRFRRRLFYLFASEGCNRENVPSYLPARSSSQRQLGKKAQDLLLFSPFKSRTA